MANPKKQLRKKVLNFDFLRIDLPEGVEPFEKFLANAKAVADLKQRSRVVVERPLRWEYLDFQEGEKIWVGDMTRMREDVIPNKASIDKPREHLKLADDEFTTEDTVFGYDPELRMLICHANRFGCGAYELVSYFLKVSGVVSHFDVLPVLTPEGYQTLEQFGCFTKVEMKIARPKKGPVPRFDNISVDSAIEAASELKAKYIDLKLYVGQSKQKLDGALIGKLVRSLLRQAGGKNSPVRRLVIQGATEAGEKKVWDMLEDRLQAAQEVEITKDRDLPYRKRCDALVKAYENERETLRKQFAEDGEDPR